MPTVLLNAAWLGAVYRRSWKGPKTAAARERERQRETETAPLAPEQSKAKRQRHPFAQQDVGWAWCPGHLTVPQAPGERERDRDRILAQVSGNGGPAPPCPPGLEPHADAVSQTRCPLAPVQDRMPQKPWGAHHPMGSLMRKWTIAEKPPRQSLQCCFSKDSLQLS